MIFKDASGYLVNSTGDGMDSAMRVGIINTFAKTININILHYVNERGICVRHPKHEPSNNPWNFTRDQLICLVSGLHAIAAYGAIKKIFWSHAKRLFFAQNFERDIPGSTKYPWPHKIKIGDPKDVGTWRMFDFADPLSPLHICYLVKCARIYWLYWMLPIGYAILAVQLVFGASLPQDTTTEENQMLCIVKCFGMLEFYRKCKPLWAQNTYNYWVCREEMEYADIIIKSVTAK